MKKRARKKAFKKLKKLFPDMQATLCFRWVMWDFTDSSYQVESLFSFEKGQNEKT